MIEEECPRCSRLFLQASIDSRNCSCVLFSPWEVASDTLVTPDMDLLLSVTIVYAMNVTYSVFRHSF